MFFFSGQTSRRGVERGVFMERKGGYEVSEVEAGVGILLG